MINYNHDIETDNYPTQDEMYADALKRIAELEAKNRHLHSLVKQLGDQVGETALKNQRLRFEEWHDKALREYAEVLNSDSHALELAYKAGRAYQREFDAGIALTRSMFSDFKYCPETLERVAKAIREQKIDE